MIECFECTATGNLHSHHVVPRSKGGTKTVLLCEECHSLVHEKDMRISALTRSGLARNKASGTVYSQVPHGFCRDGNRLVPNQAEITAIEIAFELRCMGASLRDISHELQMRGFLNRRGAAYNHKSIRSMLIRANSYDPR